MRRAILSFGAPYLSYVLYASSFLLLHQWDPTLVPSALVRPPGILDQIFPNTHKPAGFRSTTWSILEDRLK